MAKNIKPVPTAPTATDATQEWFVLAEGWYCGKWMEAGEIVTHVGIEQLTADEGQRVERRPAKATPPEQPAL